MEVTEALWSLTLESLSPDFVDYVWDNEFMGESNLPEEYQEHIDAVGVGVIDEIIRAVDIWQDNPASTDKSWRALSDLGVDHRALLSLLSHLIICGQKKSSNPDAKYLALRAAILYIKLLAVSGSRVYHAFHQVLCMKAVSTLKFGVLLKKKGRRLTGNICEDLCSVQLTLSETDCLTKQMRKLVKAILLFVTKFNLHSDEELLEEIVEHLCETTRLGIKSLSDKSYEALKSLCNPEHGAVEDTVLLIMKYLQNNVLFSDSDLSFREHNVLKEQTIDFIRSLLNSLGMDAYRGVKVFVHNIFKKTCDKADSRQNGKGLIVTIMEDMPQALYTDMLRWLFDCAHSERATCRLFALEIIAQLLYVHHPALNSDPSSSNVYAPQSTNEPGGEQGLDGGQIVHDGNINANASAHEGTSYHIYNTPPNSQNYVSLYKYVLAVIFARWRDSAANVRTKALSLTAIALKSNNVLVRSLMNEMFVLNQQHDREKGILTYQHLLTALRTRSQLDPLPGAKSVLLELKTLTCDKNVLVRRAALQVLENIMKVNRSWLTGEILKMLGICCRDPAVSIRKEMVQILSDLIQDYPDDPGLIKLWAKSVVPLVFDQEGKLQECLLRAMYIMIINNVKQYNVHHVDIWSSLPWRLLAEIVNYDLLFAIMKACEVWVKEKQIRDSLVNDVCSHIGTENDKTAWILLYCLSLHLEFKNPMFAVQYYRRALSSKQVSKSLLVIVLEVLLSCCIYLHRQVQEDLLSEIIISLKNWTVERELIRLNVEIAMHLTYHLEEFKEDARRDAKKWTNEILELCQSNLENTFKEEARMPVDTEKFLRQLLTLGEVAMHNPKQIRQKTLHLLQRFLFLPEGNSSGILSAIPVAKPYTVVVVGKICLLNQIWAQETASSFVKLLNSTQDLPTLINVMYVLRDLCIRYGAVMEPHLPTLWICLKDAAVEVRLTSLTCLVELLQNNYIKLRGAMFFHMLTMLCDTNESVVELATYFFQEYLIPLNSKIMFEHIIDALFHYNGYRGHEKYGNHQLNRKEREKFLMMGEVYRQQREKLYFFMLESMDDKQRVDTKKLLVEKILEGAAEGYIHLTEMGESVILDALHVLKSKHIHPRALLQETGDDAGDENAEQPPQASALANLQKKLITQLEKSLIVDTIVPVAIHLKAVLQQRQSRLVPHLMEYLRDILRDYKNEVKQIFAEDKQTAIEILHDISELERIERRSENVQIIQLDAPSIVENELPQRYSSILNQISSQSVRESIGPEILRCYMTGGDRLLMQYACTKLRQLHERKRSASTCTRPGTSQENVMTDCSVKEEVISNEGGDERDLNCLEQVNNIDQEFIQTPAEEFIETPAEEHIAENRNSLS